LINYIWLILARSSAVAVIADRTAYDVYSIATEHWLEIGIGVVSA